MLLFIRNRKKYISKIYKYNILTLLNISQVFIFFLNIYYFALLGIVSIIFNYCAVISYMLHHNKILKEINDSNNQYVNDIEV